LVVQKDYQYLIRNNKKFWGNPNGNLSGWEWKKPAWKKPLVLTGKNRAEKPRHFKGKTGFSWVFHFLGRFY
jgi:hypothetical protein